MLADPPAHALAGAIVVIVVAAAVGGAGRAHGGKGSFTGVIMLVVLGRKTQAIGEVKVVLLNR